MNRIVIACLLTIASTYSFNTKAAECEIPFAQSQQNLSEGGSATGDSTTSSAIAAFGCEDEPISAPTAPSNLVGPTSDEDGNFTLTFSPSVGITIGGHYILHRLDSAGNFDASAQIGRTQTSYDVEELAPGTYTYQLRGCNVDQNGIYDDECSGWATSNSITVAVETWDAPFTWTTSTHNEIVGDFDNNGVNDVIVQPKTAGDDTGLFPVLETDTYIGALHKAWTDAHPDISAIEDWSEESYGVYAGNFTSEPGDELLMLGTKQIILLHGDIITPITIFQPVRNAIVSWNASNVASHSEFEFDANPADFVVHVGDLTSDGLDEIFLQAKSSGGTSYILDHTGSLIQTISNGYRNVEWSAASYDLSIENGEIIMTALKSSDDDNVARTGSSGAITSLVDVVTKPTLLGTYQKYAFESSNYSFTPTFTSSATSNTFSATGMPSWMSVNSTTGELSGTPSVSDIGQSSSIKLTIHEVKTHTVDVTMTVNIEVVESFTISETGYTVHESSDGTLYLVSDNGADVYKVIDENGITYVLLSSLDEFNSSDATISANYTVSLRDFNSDGYIDLMLYDASGDESSSHIIYSISSTTHTIVSGQGLDFIVPDAAVTELTKPIHDPTVGEIDVNPGISGGQASLSIPIMAPPGRMNMAPNISLSYSSSSDNGLVGKGWSISGLSTITRCAANDIEDGYTRGVQMSSSDRLCLDGQKLIKIGTAAYGARNSEYRTIKDQFSKIVLRADVDTSSPGSLSSTSYFEVITKSGVTHTYGLNPTTNTGTPLSWKLDNSEDLNGNLVEYVYNDQYGQEYITNVFYTGFNGVRGTREIRFEYEGRNDKYYYEKFGSSFSSKLEKRLARVTSYLDGTEVFDYELNYRYSNLSDVSLLETIELCAFNETEEALCLPKREFEWTGESRTYETKTDTVDFFTDIEYWNTESQIIADLNADGILDFIVFDKFFPGEYDPVSREYSLDSTNSVTVPFDTTGPDNIHTLAHFDYDNDGQSELLGIKNGKMQVAFLNESQSAFTTEDLGISMSCGESVFYNPTAGVSVRSRTFKFPNNCFANVFPDGSGGHLIFYRSVYESIYVLRISDECGTNRICNSKVAVSTSDGVDLGLNIQSYGISTDYGPSQIFDYDGDGDMDVVFISQDNRVIVFSQNNWDNFSSISFTKTIQSFSLSGASDFNRSAELGGGYHWIDANGDGLQDLLALDYVGADANASYGDFYEYEWSLALNKGGYLANFESTGIPEFRIDNYGNNYLPKISRNILTFNPFIKIIDYNGDGKQDILVPSGTVGMQRDCTTVDCMNGNDDSWHLPYQVVSVSNSNWHVYLSNVSENSNSFTQQNLGISGTYSYFFPVDLNHDGVIDFLTADNLSDEAHEATSAQYVITHIGKNNSTDLAYAEPGDLIKSVTELGTNVFGNDVEFEYAPYSHTKNITGVSSLDLAEDYVRIPTTTTVVTAMDRTNGLGGQNRLAVEYGTPIFHVGGLGMVGFESIQINDLENSTHTLSEFEYQFPINGQIASTEYRKTSNNRLLESTTYTYCFGGTDPRVDCAGGHQGVYTPIQTSNVKESFELDGSLVSTATTTIVDYDEVYGNITSSSVTSVDATTTHTKTTTSTYYPADSLDWWVNKLDKITSVSSVTYTNDHGVVSGTNNSVSTTQTFDWKTNDLRQADKIVVSASDTAITNISKFLSYDTYGNVTKIEKTGDADSSVDYTDVAQSIISEFSYSSSEGYFLNTEKNGVWTEEINTKTYDERFGIIVSQTDINGLTLTNKLDAFGRPKESSSSTSPTVYLATQWCTTGCVDNAVQKVTSTSNGKPTTAVEIDRNGNKLKTSLQAFSANELGKQAVLTTSLFDSLGRLTQQKEAHFENSSISEISYQNYDVFGRYTTKVVDSAPQDYTITYDYKGLLTEITVESAQDGSRLMKRKYNGLRQLMSTMDADNQWTYFRYDAAGNPILIKDVAGNIIAANYNGLGSKIWFDDPNMGRWDFRYNGLGQLRWQKDANQTETRSEYDGLGRTVEQYVNGVLDSYWVFDGDKKGTLSLQSRNNHSKEFFYDEKLNLSETITTIEDGGERVYNMLFSYDAYYNRVKGMQFPSGEIVATSYDQYGYGVSDYNPLNGDANYREIKSLSARGKVELQQYGNGLFSKQEFSASGEHLRVCVSAADTCGSLPLEDVFYGQYDGFGNLKEQWDAVNNVTESFVYDNLHRLEQSSRVATGSILPEFNNSINNYDYDAAGNLLLKSDYATDYDYTGTGGPNAVSSITKLDGSVVNFTYDSNGNIKSGDGRTINYNHFNKPIEIIKGSVTNTFEYGADSKRYLQKVVKGSKTITTYYVDKVYEDIVEVDTGSTKQTLRHYLGGFGIINIEDGVRKTSYTHRNRLGSASLITDGDSHVDDVSSEILIQERRGFDPFGKARDAYWGDSLNGLLSSNLTSRGFTDHEHLDDVELIHMNGRAYDYNLGRFLSVDPLISFPKNSQSLNSYSYVLNNPLSGTDPSGYDISKRTKPIDGIGARAIPSKKKLKMGRTKEALKKASKGWVTTYDNGSLVSTGIDIAVGNISESSGSRPNAIGSATGPAVGNNEESGTNQVQPRLFYMELENGVDWSDLSAGQQEFVKNQSSMNTHAIGEILAIPPGSKLETEEIKQLKSSYSELKFIYHKNTKSGVLAEVPHQAWGDDAGLINRVAFSKEIHFFGLTMSRFSSVQTVTSSLASAGYHQPIRRGKNGLLDLANHEIAHTVNQTNPLGKTGADFQKMEETRADDFLKKMRY